jgi:hypothetical protein
MKSLFDARAALFEGQRRLSGSTTEPEDVFFCLYVAPDSVSRIHGG